MPDLEAVKGGAKGGYKHSKLGGATYGGCGCMLGGVEDLAKYEESVYSRNKEQLVKKLAKEVGPLFNHKGLENKSMKEIHAVLKKIVPDPKSDRIGAKHHEKVCNNLTKAINNVYGRNVIDTNASTEDKCQAVGELLNSAFTGLHSEFVVVARDVRDRMNALETLLSILDSAKSKLVANNAKVQDPLLKADNQNSEYLMNEVITEANKQMAHLKHMLNVAIEPAEKDMLEE